MGRIMSFGQDGQLVRDFDKSEYDFLRRYGRTPDEVMAENAKLREFISDAEESARLILGESRALEAENAKLRELVKDYEHCSMHADCSRCEYDGKLSTHCPLSPCFPDTDELRNIGVEVDA